ncbi:MAG: hypothetical protein J6V93_02545 [Clostridia bacterium]|nr:hypothetical protein [Clostridia bacterium]
MKNGESGALDIIAVNLKEGSASISGSLTHRLAMLDALCELANRDQTLDPGDAELVGMYVSSLKASLETDAPTDSEKIKEHLRTYTSSLRTADLVTLARMLYARAEKHGGYYRYSLLEAEENENELSDMRIVYRKAHGADIAFEKFVSLIPDAVALYKDTFPAICDAVALGEADMCILPYENTEDGKLSGFYRLIESFELKIAASVLVRSDRREDMTRYLLLSKDLNGLSAISGVTDFELSLIERGDGALSRSLDAANLLDIRLRSIDTVRSEAEAVVYDVRVTANERALDEFILYLKLDGIDFTPLGLYAVIDE